MARENVENWKVKKSAKACRKCGEAFQDKQRIFSRLLYNEGEYIREDYCEKCWDPKDTGLSSWKTLFILPLPPSEEPVKKENAESLLRKLMKEEDETNLNTIYILAVMLERKKILVERDVQHRKDGVKIRFYEHRVTGESFMIPDPELKLADLEKVQEEVVKLLDGKSRNTSLSGNEHPQSGTSPQEKQNEIKKNSA